MDLFYRKHLLFLRYFVGISIISFTLKTKQYNNKNTQLYKKIKLLL